MGRRRKRVHFFNTLKSRLRMLLIVTIIIPVISVGTLTWFKVYGLYKENTDTIINNELNELRDSMKQAYTDMLYMSQQLVFDGNIGKRLYTYFDESDPHKKVSLLKYLNEQIAIYEIANPNISNITYMYKNDLNQWKKISNSLIGEKIPENCYRLMADKNMVYYGPHTTLAKPLRYPVVSMLRKLSVSGYDDVYIYIESGYNKKMSFFTTQTLDNLNATYMVISANQDIIYNSNPQIDVSAKNLKITNNKVKLNKTTYIAYEAKSELGWSLMALVPVSSYTNYMTELLLGYLTITVGTILLGIVLYYLIWNSVNRPFKQFERNLKYMMNNDSVSELETINVKEMYENFEYFSKMKVHILELIKTVQQEEKQKSKLKIKQLLSKINPHFLHNTLDTLKWHAQQQGYQDVVKFVSSLNRLLMYNMEKDNLTTLESELSSVKDYIVLQSYKYDIEYYENISIPKAMLKTEIPRFILQPLVENAILHGVEGTGKIQIDVSLLPSGKISIKICNNGFPINDEIIERIMHSDDCTSSNGIGIQYVRQMLNHKFEDNYELTINRNVQNETQVEIIVPFSKGDVYVKDFNC